jgi:hypothetical protein
VIVLDFFLAVDLFVATSAGVVAIVAEFETFPISFLLPTPALALYTCAQMLHPWMRE